MLACIRAQLPSDVEPDFSVCKRVKGLSAAMVREMGADEQKSKQRMRRTSSSTKYGVSRISPLDESGKW